jgi:hemolysin activation/secretion protein
MTHQLFARAALSAALFIAFSSAAQTATESATPASPMFEITAFQVEGSSLLSAAQVNATLLPFQGKQRSMADVNAAAAALKTAYGNAGYLVVQVYAPEQTLAGGNVSLRVTEGKVANIVLNGLSAYTPSNILASVPNLQKGAAPNATQISADIALANENPAKQLAINFQAGQTPGEVDARLDVTEDRISKWGATYDNTGSAASGYSRVSLNYQHANIADKDHLLNLNLSSTLEKPDKGASITAGYHIPFYGQGVSVDITSTYSNSNTTTPTPAGGSLDFVGEGTSVGFRLNRSLSSVGALRHKVSLGYDYKDFANKCTLFGNPIPCGTVTARPVSLAYSAQVQTPDYQTGGSLSYAKNHSGGVHGSEAEYDAARPNAPTDWAVWRASGFVALPLPQDWQLRVAGSTQQSSHVLLPGEQFGLGGANSVRGYAERAVAGDAGFVSNFELYTPDFGARLHPELKVRGVFFYDFGQIRSQTAGSQALDLASWGAGVRLNYGKGLSIKADLGISLTPSAEQTPGTPIPTMPSVQAWGLKPTQDNWGLHLSAAHSF